MRIRYFHAEDLIIDRWHPAGGSGTGILRIAGTGRIVDSFTLREDRVARIISDDPEQVCRILGIPYPDRQVVKS